MKGPTHEFLGGCAAFGVSRALNLGPIVTVGLIAVAVKTSRLPDQAEGGILPHRGPTHRVWMTLVMAGIAAAAVMVGWPLLMEWIWTHMHDALPTIFGAHAPWGVRNLATILASMLAGGVAVGYGAHLLADGMTRSGIMVGGRRVHLMPRGFRVRTGSSAERLVQLIALCLVALYVYLAWWPK